jgi:protein ImuB
VLAEERPQGIILKINTHARRAGIRPGLRYAAGLALAPTLCAGTVTVEEITASVSFLTEILGHFTPDVEPCSSVPGLFWLNAAGISRLYGSLCRWAQAIVDALQERGFRATVVVGFSRFGTYALATTGSGIIVLSDPVQEQAAVQCVPLPALTDDPVLSTTLEKLGIHTIGEFVQLPPSGLLERFGPVAARLHDRARGELWHPLQPITVTGPLQHQLTFEVPETETTRLLFAINRALPLLVASARARHEALVRLELQFTFAGEKPRLEQIALATPTLDARLLVNLIRLRLDSLALPAGVTAIILTAYGTPATTDQLRLFPTSSRRDLAAADRAVAQVRAAFGNEAVMRVRLRDAHLPEARFVWEPLDHMVPPQPWQVDGRPLVRRVFAKSLPLPPPPRDPRAQPWLIAGWESGPVVRLSDAGVISGGWWQGEVQREYYFAETARGDVFWVYYDRRRQQWRCQGRVE